MKKLQWPRLLRFNSGDGETHELPLRPRGIYPSPLSVGAEDTLQYLAGFFDGDGCVEGHLSNCRLVVGQSFDNPEILMLFQATLGGSIARHSQGRGLRKPMLKWVLCGPNARVAARHLAQYSLTKQRQLLLAADWTETATLRQDSLFELSRLKRYDSAVIGACSDRYLAGFFDAEGYIHVKGNGSLQLRMDQKFRTVLGCLRRFFAQNLGIRASLSVVCNRFVLSVHRTSSAKQALRSMLTAGMIRKEKQAKLALTLTPENAAHVRAALGELVGNQSFGKKLDEAGMARAQEIASMRAKAVMHPWQVQELERLKLDHEILNARHENKLLLRYKQQIETLQGELWEVGD